MEENLCDLELKVFFNTTSKSWPTKEKIDKLDFCKSKNFHSSKDNVKQMKRQATDWERIFAIMNLINDLYIAPIKNF